MARVRELQANAEPEVRADPAKPLAVIDLGATAVRMVLAQPGKDGKLQTLEALQRSISLGKDTFTGGEIDMESVEECVRALRDFCKILGEYRIDVGSPQIRAVATSAVREAGNRDSFLDRIYIATGLDIEVVDSAEIGRFAYLGILPDLTQKPFSGKGCTVVAEIGGGSIELLALEKDLVLFSEAHRFGSLRFRQMMDDYSGPAARLRDIVATQTNRVGSVLRGRLGAKRSLRLLAMGGDARFAAERLVPDHDAGKPVRLDLKDVAALTEELVELSVDDIVRSYHVTYPEAETLGPALLGYVHMAAALRVKSLYVTSATMRDGVLAAMASRSAWSAPFTSQIISSAMTLARRYNVDEPHAEHVAKLARKFFRFLREEHRLGPHFELILTLGALLHEVGMYVSNSSHHKHSMYLIQNSEIFGLGERDIRMIALVARYHRRSGPKPSHAAYASLRRDERIAVAKLSAILRVADALERSHVQRIRHVDLSLEEGRLVIGVRDVADLSCERMGLEQKSEMFEQVYGLKTELRKL